MMEAKNGIWNRTPIRAFLLVLALAGVSLTTQAAKLNGWGTAGVSSNGAKSFSITPGAGDLRVPIQTPGGGWQMAGNYGIQNGPTGTTFRLGADGQVFRSMPDGTTIKYPAHVEAPLPLLDIASAAAGLLTGPLGIACAIGCSAIAEWLKNSNARINPETGNAEIQQAGSMNCSVASPCYLYTPQNYGSGSYRTGQGACEAWIAGANVAVPTYSHSLTSGPSFFDDGSGGYCTIQAIHKTDGTAGNGNATFSRRKLESGTGEGGEPTWVAPTFTQLKDKLSTNRPDISAVKELLDKGADIALPGSRESTSPGSQTTVTGPSTVTGPRKEETHADGTRTVSSTTYNFSTSANTVTNTTNNVTNTTYNTDNSIRSTSTTTQTPTDDTAAPGEEEKEDPCKANPDRIGCMETDVPEAEIPRSQKEITFAPEDVLGNGSCPANVIASFHSAPGLIGVKLLDWQAMCDTALPLRAIILAMASIMAFFIVMPGGRVE